MYIVITADARRWGMMNAVSDYDRDAHAKIAALDQDLNTEIRLLKERLKQLASSHDDLTATVAVLRQMLVEAGQLDDTVLKYRAEAARDEARELRAIPRCYRCREARPSNRMLMTEYGWACDPNCEATR